MYYHLVMPLLKGINKVNSLPEEEEYIEEGRSHIHTPRLIHLFNKIFIEFLFIARHEVALIECSMSACLKRMRNWENVEDTFICIHSFIQ